MYVRDRDTNTITLVSRAIGATGASGGGASRNPAIARDGMGV